MTNAHTKFVVLILTLALTFGMPFANANALPDAPATYFVTVTGTWKFYDKNLVAHNLRDARVEIWDYNTSTPHVLLETTDTNANGYYQTTVDSEDPGGPDIYVKVFARDDYSVWVGSSASDINTTYSKSSTIYWNRPNGTLNVGTIIIDDPADRMAFYIYDLIADDAYYYLSTNVGWVNSYNLPVQWYPGSLYGTGYDDVEEKIYLLGVDRWDSDVILHEYAHFVMDKIYAAMPPHPNCGVDHQWAVPSSEGCAWTEGWATFLQAAIQNDKYYEDTEDDPNNPVLIDIEIPDDSPEGADVEGAVTASLWDVFDSETEGWDDLASGINGSNANGIWKNVYDTDPNTAKEFETQWMGSNNGFNCQVIGMFAHHAIGKKGCADIPDLRNQSGWVSQFYVYNEGPSLAYVRIKYYDADGNPTLMDTGYDECGLVPKQWCWIPVNAFNRIQTIGSAVASSIDTDNVSVVTLHTKTGGLDADNSFRPSGFTSDPAFERAAPTQYAPAFYNVAYGWSSALTIMNTGSANANVTLIFRDRVGNPATTVGLPPILPNARYTLNSSAVFGGGMWIGSVEITTYPSQPVATQVSHTHTDQSTATYNAASGGASTVFVPAAYKTNYNLTTGLIVQNIGTANTNVTVDFYNRNGTYTTTVSLGTLAPQRANGIHLSSVSGLPNNWAGSARIVSSSGQPLAAVSRGDWLNAGYYFHSAASQPGSTVYLPHMAKNASGRTTSYLVQNTSPYFSCWVTAYYYDGVGDVTYTESYNLNAYGSTGRYQGSDGNLTDGWEGSIVLSGCGTLVAVGRESTSNSTTTSAWNALAR